MFVHMYVLGIIMCYTFLSSSEHCIVLKFVFCILFEIFYFKSYFMLVNMYTLSSDVSRLQLNINDIYRAYVFFLLVLRKPLGGNSFYLWKLVFLFENIEFISEVQSVILYPKSFK